MSLEKLKLQRVLIVDDVEAIRSNLRESLKSLGFSSSKIDEVENG
jgi:CheY-like chemotaxis protein